MATSANTDFRPLSAFLMYNTKTCGKQKMKKRKRKNSFTNVLTGLKQNKYQQSSQQSNSETGKVRGLITSYPSSYKQNFEEKDTVVVNDDPTIDASNLFKWLINPIVPHNFFNMYWEQKSLYIKRSTRNYYAHIFNSESLDEMLRNNSLHYTRNVDVVTFENGIKEVYNQEGRATPSALWDYFSNGCSIRILNPQTYNHKVHLLLATLQEYFGTMVGANVYLTPPGSQGFAPHYDDIEAFVIQLEGRKHWKLYHPKDADMLARYSSPNLKHEDIGAPFMELTLNAGEMLYFPRGTIHEGYTDADSHSLHITVSVYQQTSYTDLLEHILPDALKIAAKSDVEFRRGLPLNYLKQFGFGVISENENLLKTKVNDLIHALVKYVDVDYGVAQLGRKFMRDAMPPVLSKSEAGRCSKSDGSYLNSGRIINRVEIDLNTRIRLLRYYCIHLVHDRNSCPKLYYNTENATVYHGEEEQCLELEPSMIPSIRTLLNTYPCYIEVEKLPMDDVVIKMQLVSDLWEHGLLITERPLEILDD